MPNFDPERKYCQKTTEKDPTQVKSVKIKDFSKTTLPPANTISSNPPSVEETKN